MNIREKALKKVNDEYNEFRDRILGMESVEVLERIRRIQFYCYIREYFEYNEKIEYPVMEFTAALSHPVQMMWDFYLKNESCHCDTWEEITALIHTMMEAEERGTESWQMISKAS